MILFQVGYVQLDDPDSVEIVTKYDVAPDANSMLIFQENTRLPVVQVSMKDLPLATLLDVLESHQFLQLPRLSSQEVFDHLCPPGNFGAVSIPLRIATKKSKIKSEHKWLNQCKKF